MNQNNAAASIQRHHNVRDDPLVLDDDDKSSSTTIGITNHNDDHRQNYHQQHHSLPPPPPLSSSRPTMQPFDVEMIEPNHPNQESIRRNVLFFEHNHDITLTTNTDAAVSLIKVSSTNNNINNNPKDDRLPLLLASSSSSSISSSSPSPPPTTTNTITSSSSTTWEDWLYPPNVPRSCQLLRFENLAVPMCYLLVGILQGLFGPLINVYPLDLNASEAQQVTLSSIKSLPSTFKIFFGFLSDTIPLFGYRRKSYMMIGWILTSISLWGLLFGTNLEIPNNNNNQNNTTNNTSKSIPSIPFLGLSLLLFGTGYWMADVMGDSIVAEKAKLEPIQSRGSIQSSCYAYRFFGVMIAAPCSTILYSTLGPPSIFMVLTILPLCILPFVYYLEEIPVQKLPQPHQHAPKQQPIHYHNYHDTDHDHTDRYGNHHRHHPQDTNNNHYDPLDDSNNNNNSNSNSNSNSNNNYRNHSHTKEILMVNLHHQKQQPDDFEEQLPTTTLDDTPVMTTATTTTTTSNTTSHSYRNVASTRDQCYEIWNTVCGRAVWQPMGFVYLYNLLQVQNGAWREFLKTTLGFTANQLNALLIVAYILLYLGILAYKYYMIHWSWRKVYIVTTFLGGFFSLLQLCLIYDFTFGLSYFWFCLGDDAFSEFIGGIQFLPTTIMMVHLCPSGSEGASYAMFTTASNSALILSSALSTNLLGIWDVSKIALSNHQLSGLANLTYLTTLIQMSGILFVGWLPNTKEDLVLLNQQTQKSWVGGALFLTITFGSVLYALTVGILNIVAPGWSGES